MSYLNMTVLNRQAKEAFKANKLRVGVLENADGDLGLTIFTLHNIYWIDVSNVPNKVKAIVADLLGFIPGEIGEVWEGRSKDEPQICDPKLIESLHKGITGYTAARAGYVETGVSIRVNHQEIRLIQNKADLHIKGVKQEFLDVIDETKLDFEIENTPTGPIYCEDNGFVYYSNATTLFVTTPYPIGANDYAEQIVDMLLLLDLDPNK